MQRTSTPTHANPHSHSMFSAAFSILFTMAIVSAWLGWIYWRTSSDIENAKRVADVQMQKERAFTARLEAAERRPSPLEAK